MIYCNYMQLCMIMKNDTTGNTSNHPNHLQSKQVNISKASPLPTTELPLGSPANKGTTLWYLRGDTVINEACGNSHWSKGHKYKPTRSLQQKSLVFFFEQAIRRFHGLGNNPHITGQFFHQRNPSHKPKKALFSDCSGSRPQKNPAPWPWTCQFLLEVPRAWLFFRSFVID